MFHIVGIGETDTAQMGGQGREYGMGNGGLIHLGGVTGEQFHQLGQLGRHLGWCVNSGLFVLCHNACHTLH